MKKDRGTLWFTLIFIAMMCVGGLVIWLGTIYCTNFQCGLSMPTTVTTTVVLPTGTEKVENLSLLDDSIYCRYDKTCASRYMTIIVNGVWHTIVLDGTSFGELRNNITKLSGTTMDLPYWEDLHQKYYVYFGEKTAIYSSTGALIWKGSSLQ
ncbi:MAG: hypothetical protein UT37_C0009G0001 [Parcubacteria group bacterium GW2011_GWA2_39_18]|nr:MAG: hypothetical protein UT37_C0009G0001 [Parcubacteria group bacterium GW2011_GWA2_39_18]